MKTLDCNDPELIKSMENVHSCHIVVSKQLDIPVNIALYTYDKAITELKFITTQKIAAQLAELSASWKKEKNPYYIDLVSIICNEANITPTPALQDCINEAAKARFYGELAGTPDKIKTENAKSAALLIILNCIYAGYDLDISVGKATTWHKRSYPNLKQYTHQTLARYYRNTYRKKMKSPYSIGMGEAMTTQEKMCFASWDRFKINSSKFREGRKIFEKIIANLPREGEF